MQRNACESEAMPEMFILLALERSCAEMMLSPRLLRYSLLHEIHPLCPTADEQRLCR